MIRRDLALAALKPHIADDVVVSVYTAAFDWIRLRPDHPLNYNSVGAMGLASSHGLGLALARPDRRIVVLDGDGSLLMNLGALVTAANLGLPNFYHFVCRNGTYEANGGHPIPGQAKLSFAAIARGAGYAAAHCFDDLATFSRDIGAILDAPGPAFIELLVTPGEKWAPAAADYEALYSQESRDRFRAAFAT